ncbi:benzoate-CoA ligase family protein [Sphingomonas sp. MAH-20]|uniref:Benzoate-CoA ligase family protein n=1 Tax=Sphingomonas horti TaxID=2682842 RepID=A0A6I4J1I2_9SPHN|nr:MULTISPECIES: benzoate-CoA ligase family protein [Sphingomonas]MBA2919622.1 benzoate-CoA ligase family protein [Sphingomonas sp. CGMCC 1.13658]MVO78502.1 benzoate-CoA ligase family protein [Sphingomonas horti]
MDDPVFPDDFNMADWFLATGAADKTAILFEDQAITYAEVREKVDRVARRLVTEGLLPEQRVLVCMRDCPEFAYAWFGAIKAGAVVTQINPLLPEADYSYYLDYVKPQFVFVDEASAVAFGAAAKASRHGRGVIGDFDAWLAAPIAPDAEPWPTRLDDPAVWLFTSGSTGKSKGAVHSHGHFPFNTEVYAKRFIGMRESDVTISGARLYFGYATGTNLMFPFAVGATTVLFSEQPSAERLFDLIERHRPSVFTSVPTLIHKMLESRRKADLSSIRFMWSAGEALPRELHGRWDQAFGVPIIDGIGSAESFHIYISNHPDDIRPGSLGRLVPGYEARLLDDEGNQVGKGDVGTLWLKGASAALCYHADYAKSVEHLRGGWIVSGDKFREDEDGYWYYEGRGDDLIKSGGIYVSPIEVENVLAQHHAVGECCVTGKKDGAGLEKPVAIVFPRPGVSASEVLAEELIAFARSRLVHYKAPREVIFAQAALPRNDRDKLDRKALRARFG